MTVRVEVHGLTPGAVFGQPEIGRPSGSRSTITLRCSTVTRSWVAMTCTFPSSCVQTIFASSVSSSISSPLEVDETPADGDRPSRRLQVEVSAGVDDELLGGQLHIA